MHISCTQENLAKGVAAVNRIVGVRSTLPILSHMLLATDKGRLTISGTDLEVALIVSIGAKVEKEGSITVPARLLADFVSSNQDKTIDLSVENTQITAKSDHVTAHLNGLDAEDFPLIPDVTSDQSYQIQPSDLKEAINHVVFATALDETRPVLTGVLCTLHRSSLTLVATDSYRLAERTIPLMKPAPKDVSCIIPARTLSEVGRLLEISKDSVTVTIAQTQVSFSFGSCTLISRILEGTYPDYKQIIPKKTTTTAQVSLGALQSALKLASSFSRDVSHNIRIVFSPNNPITITATSANIGDTSNTVDSTTTGETLEIAFNAKFILDILAVMPGDSVTIHCAGKVSPALIIPSSRNDYRTLVMPLRLDE